MNIADRIFPVLPLLVSERLTFNVNCLLNDDPDDDSYEAREILGVLSEKNVISKIQNYDESVLPSLPNVLSRQLDNDDANDDENDIDIFFQDRQT